MPQLISKEPLGSKENPIIVNDINELSSLVKSSEIKRKEHTWLQFECKTCKKTVTIGYNAFIKTGRLLCKKCKSKETNLRKYGVENPFQMQKVIEATKNRDWTERNNKSKETCLKRYGVNSPLESKEIQDKIRKTNKARYGAENPFASDELKNCRTKDSADSGTVLRVPDCFVHYQLLSNAQCKISQLTS